MSSVTLDHPAPRVARITLNRPEVLNSMGPDDKNEMERLFTEALTDDSIRACILTGAGGNFCAGGDLSTVGTQSSIEAQARIRRAQDLFRKIACGDKPIVAAVEGIAAGGGVAYACMADIIVGSRDARLFLAFLKVGMIPDNGLYYTLSARVGLARARRLLLTNATLGAQQALEMGLLDEVVDPDKVQDRAVELASQLAAGPASATASAKRGFRVVSGMLEQLLEYEAAAMAVAMSGPEFREGYAAFKEKRRPNFGDI